MSIPDRDSERQADERAGRGHYLDDAFRAANDVLHGAVPALPRSSAVLG
jgi:hypothetical protein